MCFSEDLYSSAEFYHCSSTFNRLNIRSGSFIFVHNYSPKQEHEFHFEDSAIFVDDLNVIVVSACHSIQGTYPKIFLESLDCLLVYLINRKSYTVMVGGEFN